LAAGCTVDDVVAVIDVPVARDVGHVRLVDAQPSPIDAGADFCDGNGPVLLVGDDGLVECTGLIAQTTFRFGVCSCTDLIATASVTTDAFDSSTGQSGNGGAIGVNRSLVVSGGVDIGGSLWLGGSGQVNRSARVGGKLRCAGAMRTGGALSVERDAEAASIAAASLSVTGTLSLPAGGALEVPGAQSIGAEVRRPIVVPPPCSCDPSALVDVGGFIAAHLNRNDNDAVDLVGDALGNIPGPRRVELPCGRYWFPRIGGAGPLTIVATGRAALFVAQDVSLSGGLEVELANGAELDLFVGGNIASGRPLTLGGREVASRVRLYVGGAGNLQLGGGAVFGGHVYAPSAVLVASGGVEVFGSVFVRRIDASGPLVAHYDRAVLGAGEACPESPPSACKSCVDCRNQACVNGGCASCRSDDDCCAPLFCIEGACVPPPL